MAFIVFDGPDKSGKSTIAPMITNWLIESKLCNKAILTRHPGSTPIGAQLRKLLKESTEKIDPRTEALMFAADNCAFIEQILKPELEKNNWIIGDRNNFVTSLIYQIANGCSQETMDLIHRATVGDKQSPKIDLLIIFRISEETYYKRGISRTGRDNFEQRGNDFTKKILNAYSNFIVSQASALSNIVTINKNGSLCAQYIDANQSIPQVLNDCKVLISKYFKN